MASDSSSVSAFMRTTASPSWTTLTRQSTRCSPPAAISTVCAVAPSGCEHAAVEFEDDLDLLLRLEVVVDVGREHDLVLLDEEPRGLQADEQVLGGDDLGLALADPASRAHGPGLDLPGRQALGQREVDLGDAVVVGRQRGDPVGGVGEVRADDGLDRRGCVASERIGRQDFADPSCWREPRYTVAALGLGHRARRRHRGGRGRGEHRSASLHAHAAHAAHHAVASTAAPSATRPSIPRLAVPERHRRRPRGLPCRSRPA